MEPQTAGGQGLTQETTPPDVVARWLREQADAILSGQRHIHPMTGLLVLAAATIDRLTADLAACRAEGDALRERTIDAIANKCCGELPEDFTIVIQMERGAGWVDLFGPGSGRIDSADKTIEEQVREALAAALCYPSDAARAALTPPTDKSEG